MNDAQLPGSPCLAPLFIDKLTTAVDQKRDGATGREQASETDFGKEHSGALPLIWQELLS